MKKLLLLCFLSCLAISLSAQVTVEAFNYDNAYREYRQYIPANYTGNDPVALVFNMHGYTSDAFQQEIYTQMNSVADTAGFILVYPYGLNNAWNSGFQPPYNGGVDDVGFISAMIDTIGNRYNIDPARVYACGMSNGGFMSFRLACDLENRIAAIASVTGTMTTLQLNNCSPTRAMPVLQIHGDDDGTVAYFGNSLSVSVDSTLNFWRSFNQCAAAPVYDTLPDLDMTDQSTVTSQYFGSCTDNVEILHYKVANGAHTWPGGLPIPQLGVTNNDINASREIWEFFLKWEHPNPSPIMTGRDPEAAPALRISPNPFSQSFRLQGLQPKAQMQVFSATGTPMVFEIDRRGAYTEVIPVNWPAGFYFLWVRQGETVTSHRLVHY